MTMRMTIPITMMAARIGSTTGTIVPIAPKASVAIVVNPLVRAVTIVSIKIILPLACELPCCIHDVPD